MIWRIRPTGQGVQGWAQPGRDTYDGRAVVYALGTILQTAKHTIDMVIDDGGYRFSLRLFINTHGSQRLKRHTRE